MVMMMMMMMPRHTFHEQRRLSERGHADAPTFELLVLTFVFGCRFTMEYSRVPLKLE